LSQRATTNKTLGRKKKKKNTDRLKGVSSATNNKQKQGGMARKVRKEPEHELSEHELFVLAKRKRNEEHFK
jgi:hypothetical protein